MDKKKVGQFLLEKRNALGISSSAMAQLIGINRTSVERTERGISAVRRAMITRYAEAYGVDAGELAKLCCYSLDTVVSNFDSQITASVEDLEFLITVARGLQKPLNLVTIRELLKCRQGK